MFRFIYGKAVVLSLALAASTAMAAPVRIDFSGNTPPGLPPTGPGFRISDASSADLPNVSERFQLGSRAANNLDGLNFLRITSATSTTGGSDVADFIVVIPELYIRDIGQADGNPNVGAFEDTFGLRFNTPGGTETSVVDGFAVYAASDVGLLTPLLLANIGLVEDFLIVSESGFVEGTPGLIGLSNIRTVNTGGSFATLSEFAASGAVFGADFTARINAAGQNIGLNILNRLLSEGSSNGSVETIPEPASLVLLAAGALAMIRRRHPA